MTSVKEIGALSGIKVIDLTRVLSGPFCTMLLADMGADVIKIEPPKGDNVRNQGDMVEGYSSYFAQFNRNKKSVILDLYVESEKDILRSLLSDADVVVENFKAGVFDKMGFDYNTLKIVTGGHIHNPHYYAYMRNAGLQARNPGDIPCGGLIRFLDLFNDINH